MNEDWQEFDWKAAPKMPPGRFRQMKLYADLNVPEPLLQGLDGAGVTIHRARYGGSQGRPDESVYQEARRLGFVLLTMDRDFWKDSLHPLATTKGILFVDISPALTDKALHALAQFYGLFAKYYPLDWWEGMKARVYEAGFVLRFRTWDGRIAEEEFQLNAQKLMTRTLR